MFQQLDPNLAYSHDMTKIRMLKICGKSVRPLELFFSECMSNGVFPSGRKEANVVTIHKKNDWQCLKSLKI